MSQEADSGSGSDGGASDLLSKRSLLNRHLYQHRIINNVEAQEERQYPIFYTQLDASNGLGRLRDIQGNISYAQAITNGAIAVGEAVRSRGNKYDSAPIAKKIQSMTANIEIINSSLIILFYSEDSEYITYYTGGNVVSPRQIYKIDKNSGSSQLLGYIHNYQTFADIFIIKLDNSYFVYKNKIRIELQDIDYDVLDYKGNLTYQPFLNPRILGGYIDAQENNTYQSIVNGVLINVLSIVNRPNIGQITSSIETYIPGGAGKDICQMQTRVASDDTIFFNKSRTYSKLLYSWKDGYILENFDHSISYQDVPLARPPTTTTRYKITNYQKTFDLSYQFTKKDGTKIELNSSEKTFNISAIADIPIDANTKSISIVNNYTEYHGTEYPFVFNGETFSLYPTSNFTGEPITFLKKIDNNTCWRATGTLDELTVTVDNLVTILYDYAGSYTDEPYIKGTNLQIDMNISINNVEKLNYCIPVASTTGTVILDNKSIYAFSFYSPNAAASYAPSFESIFKVLGRENYFGSSYMDEYLFAQSFNYSGIRSSNYFNNTTLKDNIIYCPYYSQDVETQNITAYIEQWKIENNGDIVRQDTVLKTLVFKLNSMSVTTSNILSASYHP